MEGWKTIEDISIGWLKDLFNEMLVERQIPEVQKIRKKLAIDLININ